MAHTTFSEPQFVRALRALPMPGGRIPDFLQAHYSAPGRALTVRRLAQAAGYTDYHGVNLHYGLLAARIGRVLGGRRKGLGLLVDFVRPRVVTNREWVLVMHPQFARALRRVGWVR